MKWNRQVPSGMPSHRYRSHFDRVPTPPDDGIGRQWPSNRLTAAPLWAPVDLRDGNQALPEPMDTARKRLMFEQLVRMGYKEIECGYPAASQADFDFTRDLVTFDLVPDDVTVVAFTAARPELIDRTFESVRGLANVVIHTYVPTAPLWRSMVLGQDRKELLRHILKSAEDVARVGDTIPGMRYQFAAEVFNLTEPDFVLEICNSLTELWDASPDRPVSHNFPTTVETATPNVYADQIEYMHRHLDRRESVILSIHTHNDRGTGVASSELAMLAGAQRVEGCLFGNGERTGNVDLVTLGLNLHSQGVDPMIDFSDLDSVRRTVEYCNRIDVHPRHPYGGDLVFTAFSGSHQDAIKKGFSKHNTEAKSAGIEPMQAAWDMPYLPIDPADIGRDYEAIIRVNSQSGKGGVAYLLQTGYGLDMPRGLQIDFARRVQHITDDGGGEVSAEELWKLLTSEYAHHGVLDKWSVQHLGDGLDHLEVRATLGEMQIDGEASASGPVEALTRILAAHGREVEVLAMALQSVAEGAGGQAITFAQCRVDGKTQWGMGVEKSVTASTLRAVLAAAAPD
ncbi:2-isopropylmalate synthase [Rhodococcus daqingensis]|uniref:2-isopropylmalate synthase n=1 Tax=Rhodococcus daqingensis TaxID=2479363 RepID=A0ABW2RT12_9NOCA